MRRAMFSIVSVGLRAVLTLAVLCASEAPGFALQAGSPLDTAVAEFQAGQVDAAVRTLQAAVDVDPAREENVYLLLSEGYARLADPARAIGTLRSGLDVHPGAPVLERALGQQLFRAQFDSAEAGVLLARSVESLPRDPAARHYYAQWAYLNGHHRICVDQEREAVLLPGLNDLAMLQMQTLLGMCHSRLAEEDGAEGARRAFESARAVNGRRTPYDPVAAFQYVQFLTRHGDLEPAAAIVDEILERTPRFGPARLEKAKDYDRAGDPARAIVEARLALEGDGNDFNVERAAHLLMARCHALLGQMEEAANEQAWIEAHPNPETPRAVPND